MNVRCTVIFRGHVQGVGFRINTLQIAGNFAVSGTVENMPDRTVRLVAEGARKELTAFVEMISEQFGHNISEQNSTWSTATGEWPDFRIAY